MRMPSLILAAFAAVALHATAETNDVERIPELPECVRAMGMRTSVTLPLTNGVVYYYGRFDDLYDLTNDLHLLRIDYRHSPVRMRFVDSTTQRMSSRRKPTSKIAAEYSALFGINGTFEGGSVFAPTPQGFTRYRGTNIPCGTGEFGGIAISAGGGTFSFAPKWNGANSADWSDVITSEAYGLHNGRLAWGPQLANVFGRANYTFAGTTPAGVIWIGVVDGRRPGISEGLNYYYVCRLLQDLGCSEGMCFDGGGSSTLVIRRNLLPAEPVAGTQRTSKFSADYCTMNALADGHERAVINQLLFVPK